MKPKDSRICIVGAGAGGLSAAYYLKERGYAKVTVLEASDRVGGKCYSVHFRGRSFDVGANYVTAAYSEVLRLARKFDAALYTEAAATTGRIAPDGTIQFRTPLAAIKGNQKFLSFAWAAARYFWIRLLLRGIVDPPGFGQIGKHLELCVSFRDWLKRNRLGALEQMFEIPITIMGYGYLDEIPAPHALKYLSLATYWNLVAVAFGLPTRWPKRFVAGFERLWHDIAAQLDVRLGVDIAAIDRRGPVRVHLGNGDVIEFDYLVVACPIHGDSLGRILKLSAEESGLFNRIVVNKYVVMSYAIPELRLPRRIIGMSPTPELGRPWAITQQYTDSDFVQFYTRLGSIDTSSKHKVIEGIRQFAAAIGAALPEECLTYNEWDYFPHVAVDDLRDGFYNRLEALQGQFNTFYCGSIAAFELVETVVQYSRLIVERYF
jgi:uncharacterized protein with NAD-binding domain and iron-sulfur cluster